MALLPSRARSPTLGARVRAEVELRDHLELALASYASVV
jgi:hypothetical protein